MPLRPSNIRGPMNKVMGSPDATDLARLVTGDHDEPHRVLGAHRASRAGVEGSVVRAFHPEAAGCDVIFDVGRRAMAPVGGGLFESFVPELPPGGAYRVC